MASKGFFEVDGDCDCRCRAFNVVNGRLVESFDIPPDRAIPMTQNDSAAERDDSDRVEAWVNGGPPLPPGEYVIRRTIEIGHKSTQNQSVSPQNQSIGEQNK